MAGARWMGSQASHQGQHGYILLIRRGLGVDRSSGGTCVCVCVGTDAAEVPRSQEERHDGYS